MLSGSLRGIPSSISSILFLVAALASVAIVPPVAACGVTIHNEVAHRASRIVLSVASTSASYGDDTLYSNEHGHSNNYPAGHRHHGKLFMQSCSSSSLSSSSPSIQSPQHQQRQQRQQQQQRQKQQPPPRLLEYAPLLQRKELLFAGSFFPDWGYNCIGKLWNDAAEKAHWPPFIEAALRYILEKYPKPWDDHAKSLIVFLFGTVSHSLGDMSWHGLEGLDQGFIQVLADTSFEGDYSKAHTLADLGAEFVLSHMSSLNHLLTSWKVPVKDITAIYKTMGYRVPGPVLSHCMRNGFTGAQANARLGSQLFPVYASKSPFLVEQVENYPIGGLHDMAGWTIDCWNGFAEYLEEDRTLPPLPVPDDSSDDTVTHERGSAPNTTSFNLCYALWEERAKNSNHASHRQHQHDHHHESPPPTAETSLAYLRLQQAGFSVVTDTEDSTGMVTFSIVRSDSAATSFSSAEFAPEETITTADFEHLSDDQHDQLTTKTKTASHADMCGPLEDGERNHDTATLYLPVEYASLGHSAVSGDFDGDGKPDLAVSAPHNTMNPMVPSQGSVFVIQGAASPPLHRHHQGFIGTMMSDKEPVDIRTLATRTLHGDPSQPQSRFGWSMAVVDLNQDGIDDLAIGAPGYGAKDLTYTGSVFVYFGRAKEGLGTQPDVTILLNTTTTTEKSHNFKDDDGGDDPSHINNSNNNKKKNMIAGLGYLIQGMDLAGSGFKDLVISMPMASVEDRNGTLQKQAGRVLAFLGAKGHPGGEMLDSDRDWELQGEKAFEWFGSSLALSTQTTTMDNNQEQPETVKEQRPPMTVACDEESGPKEWWWRRWLSPSLSSSSSSSSSYPSSSTNTERRVLIVGSPASGEGVQGALRGKIQGFILPSISIGPDTGGSQTSSAHISNSTITKIFTIHGSAKFQQLGSSLETFFRPATSQDNSSSFKNKNTDKKKKNLLVVGSRSEDVLRRLPKVGVDWQAGMVRVLDLDSIPDGLEISIAEIDQQGGQGGDSRGRRRRRRRRRGHGRGRHLWQQRQGSQQQMVQFEPTHSELGNVLQDSLFGSQALAHLSAAMQVSSDGQSLWLTEPFSSTEKGRILEWVPTFPDDNDNDKQLWWWGRWSSSLDSNLINNDGDFESVKQCFTGADTRTRFGSQLLLADLNEDGIDDVVVTAAHDSRFATMAGSVVIKIR
ncbi:Glycosylphosphatidylinositol specific phospholipase D1 [Podila humilis]|nr:Glycosylphosphatidylinositol specific phospholipase D1 [Podila humilis]